MSFGTLMVHAASDTDGAARMALAAELAARFDAMLVGVAAREVPLPLAPAHAGVAAIATMFEEQEAEIWEELAATERDFHAAAGQGVPSTKWRASVGLPVEAVVREGRGADLIVLGRQAKAEWSGAFQHPDPGDVMMLAGRPVLVVPPGVSRLEAAQVVVAWRDSREARRALHDALPFLKQAAGVLLLDICRSASGQQAATAGLEDVAGHLSRHGVAAAAEARPLREATVAAELLLAAEQRRADLVVAGGYGHSRLREWAFGGVTRTMLRHFPMCCLLSH